MKPEFDLCVIGGGAAGLTVAAGAAMLGAKVALVEKRALGGDCLHFGCVPSKALLASAKLAHAMRQASSLGIGADPPQVDIARVMERVRGVVETVAHHDSVERFQGLGVEVILGGGRFTDPKTFRVDGRTVTARHFVLATGSRPAVPPIEGLAQVPYLTNETVFDLRERVPHLIVLGGGPIGVEMAQAFRRLGSEVDIVEAAARLLPREDGDLAVIMERQLADEGLAISTRKPVLRVEGAAGEVRLLIRDGCCGQRWMQGSHLLVATGRVANVEDLGLEAAGVRVENGRPVTDARLRTTNPRVYACGDVAGPYLFTHMAEHQAGVVLRNALFRWPARARRHNVPWCTFTDPEFARVGLSETEARTAGMTCRTYTFPLDEIDRAQAEGTIAGRAKIVVGRGGRLLGAALVCPHAGELIHEYALALDKKMKASDLAGVIHIYPTFAQINRRVADQYSKEKLTPGAQRFIRLLFGLRGASP